MSPEYSFTTKKILAYQHHGWRLISILDAEENVWRIHQTDVKGGATLIEQLAQAEPGTVVKLETLSPEGHLFPTKQEVSKVAVPPEQLALPIE